MNPEPQDVDVNQESSTTNEGEGQPEGQTEAPDGGNSQMKHDWIANIIDAILPNLNRQVTDAAPGGSSSRETGDQLAEGKLYLDTWADSAGVNLLRTTSCGFR